MAITFQKELFGLIAPELPDLWLRHWEEIDQENRLDPDWQKYLVMEATGLLHVITARNTKKLIGYYMAVVTPQLHDKTCLMAFSDTLYILPEYRVGWTGYKLIREAGKMLKVLGVKKSYLVTKKNFPLIMLLKRLGYIFTEKIYVKVL
jgi:GNAT superfamily N-acetyltransferase